MTTTQICNLVDTLNRYRHEYYNLNAPSVSDSQYDRLYDELVRLETETGIVMSNSPTQTVGYEVVSTLGKTSHEIPLLSLEKTKSAEELLAFAGNQRFMLMHKLDGLTIKLEYENGSLIRASTRGDGDVGEIVTHNARAITGIPTEIPYLQPLVVVGEAYIGDDDFEEIRETLLDSTGKPYRNARNLAAGSVRNLDAAECARRRVRFSPFNVLVGFDEDAEIANSKHGKLSQLGYLGFAPCENYLTSRGTLDDLMATMDELRFSANHSNIPIDGIVLTFDDIAHSQSCGRTGHHYKDGMAFKFEDELFETVLRGVEWSPSRFGMITPVALFDAVEIDGTEVSRASLHNLTFMRALELRVGNRILVSKRNMIIPHIEENLDRAGFDERLIPPYCPSCGTATRINISDATETLCCTNHNCEAKKLRRFVHFVGEKAMDIQGLSEATLDKFIANGWVETPIDIYRLGEHEFEIRSMEGFGAKSWERLWSAIQDSRNTTFERFVVAMDIPMIGRTAARVLNGIFDGDLDEFEAAVNRGYNFSALEGFGATMNANIHCWFIEEENYVLWEELQEMVNIEKTTTAAPVADGRTIVATGKFVHFSRDSINAYIESLGAKAGSSVSKKTDYLVYGEKAGSKLAKAQELGVPVLSEQEFMTMVQGM